MIILSKERVTENITQRWEMINTAPNMQLLYKIQLQCQRGMDFTNIHVLYIKSNSSFKLFYGLHSES